MTSNWRAIALPSVRKEHIENALSNLNLGWQKVGHITATSSLCKSIRGSDGTAHNIGQFIEMLVFQSMPNPYSLNLTEFPDAKLMSANLTEYEKQESAWRAIVSGRQMKIGLEFNQSFRDFLSKTDCDSSVKSILRREKKSIRQGVQTLLGSGFGYENIEISSSTDSSQPIKAAVVGAWRYLEENFRPLNSYRDFLWIDKDEYISQKTQQSRAVRKILLGVIDIAFGETLGERTIIHHGFYFYTPPQWALFQLLRNTPGINQLFVIHDDGVNPAFESWRKFFRADWWMPEIEYQHARELPTNQAAAFGGILKGIRPSFPELGENVSLFKCRTPADFTRHWMQAKEQPDKQRPQLFAALPEEVERFVELDFNSGVISNSNLAYLPVGVFLLGVHRSIDISNIDNVKISIQGETLIDIASTQFIEGEFNVSRLVNTLKRALPFFQDCLTPLDWQNRVTLLKDEVMPQISAKGPRRESDSDLVRVDSIVNNPIRLASWIDLSEAELEELFSFLKEAVNLIEQVANSESRNLRSYLDFIGSKLETGLRNESIQVQQEILKKISGFSIGTDNKYDIDGLIEVVEILLGQQAEFSGIGEDIFNFTALPLRALDSLGLIRSKGDVLVTNLADGAFPSRNNPFPWPFTLDSLQGEYDVISREILQARLDFSTLSDLYLIWLALDGVESESKVVLSWIAELPGEVRDLSSLVKLLLKPERLSPLISGYVGGLPLDFPTGLLQIDATKEAAVPLETSASISQIEIAISKVNRTALASTFACKRRFAIQWALGPSAAFRSEHTQRMLDGNFQTILFEEYGLPLEFSEMLRDKIWIFMSQGQRASSLAKRVIKKKGQGARPPWIFTMSGSAKENKIGAYDKAYRAALGTKSPPTFGEITESDAKFLPAGVNDFKICKMCPVKSNCSQAATPKY